MYNTPTIQIPTNTVYLPDYNIEVISSILNDRLDIHYVVNYLGFSSTLPDNTRNPKDIENIMIWLNGEYVCQLFDLMNPNDSLIPKGHTWITSNTSTKKEGNVSINLRSVHTVPGDGIITVSFWDSGFVNSPYENSPGGICYINTDCNIPTIPIKTVKAGTILRCLFTTPPNSLSAGQRQAIKDAGFNCFEQQLCHNPRNSSTTLEQAKASWQSLVGNSIQTAKDMNMMIIGCGDDFARDQGAYNWTRDTVWAAEYIAWISQQCKNYGNVVCLEVQDEVGTNVINDPVYQKVRQAWTSIPGYVPMGWPALALVDNTPLEVTGWADYITRYCDPGVTVWRTGKANGQHTYFSQAEFLRQKTSNIQYHKFAVGINGGCTGPFYNKLVEGGEYQPGLDYIKSLGHTPRMIITHIALTLCYRSTMLRIYAWDGFWKIERQNSPIGSTNRQTGSMPGDERWPALIVSNQMIQEYEELLLRQAYPPATEGSFVFGYRDGLTIAVNTSEKPAKLATITSGDLWTENGKEVFSGNVVPSGGVVICRSNTN